MTDSEETALNTQDYSIVAVRGSKTFRIERGYKPAKKGWDISEFASKSPLHVTFLPGSPESETEYI